MTTRPSPYALYKDRRNGSWKTFTNLAKIIVAREPEEVIPALTAVEAGAAAGYFAAGYLAYEAAPGLDPSLVCQPTGGFPLLWFGLFEGMLEHAALQTPTYADCGPGRTSPPLWFSEISETDYQSALLAIKELLLSGETYQVNYSYRLRNRSNIDPWALFCQLDQAQPDNCGAYLETSDWAICSASPELLFTLRQDHILCRPMKGTAPRGPYPEADQKLAEWLRNSPKNQAENLMITDMARNDLARIARPGTVQVPSLFALERYPTLWQMTSTVTARTNSSLTEILCALFPGASITGAPKRHTMQHIRALERSPRNIYTGSMGFVTPDGYAQFNIAIRTALLDKHRGLAEYGVGGGIVWDSQIAEEARECRQKAAILHRRVDRVALLETLRWTLETGYTFLPEHLERLSRSATYFGYTIDLEAVEEQLQALAGKLSTRSGAWRIQLRVGPEGDVELTHAPLRPLPTPYRLAVAHSPLPAPDDPFVYHKTTNRSHYELFRQRHPDADDVLLWNPRRETTESTIANLVVELDGIRYTPPVRCGLLNGVARQHYLDQGFIQERVITVTELQECTSLWLLNSVRGLWPVELMVCSS